MEKDPEPKPDSLAIALHNLAWSSGGQKKYLEAEGYYLRSLEIKKKIYTSNHPKLLITLSNLAKLYKEMDRSDDAKDLEERIKNLKQSKRDKN